MAAVVAVGMLPILSAGVASAEDPLQGIKDLVVSQRLSSRCGPLNYNVQLERDAQYLARNTPPGGSFADVKYIVSGYSGIESPVEAIADPKARALELMTGSVRAKAQDCSFVDYGVGFYRNEANEVDYVTVIFGKPPVKMPDLPELQPKPEDPKPTRTLGKKLGQATVTNDVDVYDAPNGTGKKVNGLFLHKGSKYDLLDPCADNWCHLIIPAAPGNSGWVYQDGFLSVP